MPRDYARSWTASVGRARVSRTSSAGWSPAMCRSEPAPTQTRLRPNRVRSIRTCWTACGSGNGATPPGSKPVASSTSSGARHLRLACPDGRGDLARVRPPVARDEHDDGQPVGEEDERLDDLGGLAAHRLRGVLGRRRAFGELLDGGLGPGFTEERGDALHRLGPLRHARSVAAGDSVRTGREVPARHARSSSCAPGGGGGVLRGRPRVPARRASGVSSGRDGARVRPTHGEPFYHFALLVPGDRFAAALEWASARARCSPRRDGRAGLRLRLLGRAGLLLPRPGRQHRRADRAPRDRAVGADGRVRAGGARRRLGGRSRRRPAGSRSGATRGIGLEVWSGTVDGPEALAFVGEQARTFILAPSGRGWLPTGRPAEPHPIEAVIEGPVNGEVDVGDPYRVISRAR